MRRSVIVVGAGLAGLTAARRLSADGFAVTVLEARSRVGGRTWSVTSATGDVVELGGEWICSHQDALLGLAAELGLATQPAGLEFPVRDALGRPPIPPADHAVVAATARTAFDRLDDEARVTTSLGAFLAALDGPTDALAVLRSRLTGSAAMPLDEVGVEELDGCFGVHDGGRSLRIADGNQRLAEAMARELDVRLQHVAVAVEDGTVRTADGASHDADAIVLAVPLPILAALPIEPVPPIAFERLRMGLAAKAWIRTGAAPLLARQSLDVPIWAWNGARADGSPRRVLTSFAGGEVAIAEALRGWRDRFARLVPEAELVGDVSIVDWSRDPFALGAHSALGPGDAAALTAFERPHGAVVFAGEHTNGSGTMDGAVRSGERAARLVRELLAA